MIETVNKTLVVGKETSEVADALRELILDIRAGKDIAAIASENLPGVVTAVEGYDKIDEEIKHESRADTSGYVVAQIFKGLDTKVGDDAPSA